MTLSRRIYNRFCALSVLIFVRDCKVFSYHLINNLLKHMSIFAYIYIEAQLAVNQLRFLSLSTRIFAAHRAEFRGPRTGALQEPSLCNLSLIPRDSK